MTCLVAERQHIHIFLTGVQKLAIPDFSVAALTVFIFSFDKPADYEQIVSTFPAMARPAHLNSRPSGATGEGLADPRF